MPYILTSQTSEYKTTSQLALSHSKARRASFWLPHTTCEASQSSGVVNEAREPSIALTRLTPNSPRLVSSRLVAISDHGVPLKWWNDQPSIRGVYFHTPTAGCDWHHRHVTSLCPIYLGDKTLKKTKHKEYPCSAIQNSTAVQPSLNPYQLSNIPFVIIHHVLGSFLFLFFFFSCLWSFVCSKSITAYLVRSQN